MNPITHFLVSYSVASKCNLTVRDEALVVAGGLIADIDGLGAIGDFAHTLGLMENLWLYEKYHHILCHNMLFGLIITICAMVIARNKLLTGFGVLLTFHLHILCDIAGSGGALGYNWPIAYFYPSNGLPRLEWAGQWALASWQNTVITFALMGEFLYYAQRKQMSFIRWFSKEKDNTFITILNKWFTKSKAQTS